MTKKLLISTAFMAMLFLNVALAQTQTITGTVSSTEDNGPIPGVSVFVSGTTRSTQTDEKGQFSIESGSGETLVFRAIGYREGKQTVGTSSLINISLAPSIDQLDEVVVVGYGTVRRADFTGSAVTVGAADIDKRPLSNVLSALQGAGPGIQTTVPSGAPGSEPTIRIRGVGSYSASNDPLIIVDGVEFTGGMANINPADVESITTLKDAATIAIYGSRGANGVIMITTKKGKEGVKQLNAQAQFGTNTNMMPNYRNVGPGQYYELMWEAYRNSLRFGNQQIPDDVARQIASGQLPRNANNQQVYNGSNYQDLVQFLGNYNAYNVPNTDLISTDGRLNSSAQLLYGDDLNWEEQASRTGRRNEYNVDYSAGFSKSDLFVSLNYLEDRQWALNSKMDAIRARVNVNTEIKPWLRTGLNLNANYNNYSNGSFSTGIVNPFAFARGIGPIYPVHVHDPMTGEYILDAQGERIYDIGDLAAQFGLSRPYNSGRHAIAENLWNRNLQTRDFVGGRGYVDINILPWLTFNATMSFDLRNQRQEEYQNTVVGDGAPAGRFSQTWNRRLQYTFFQTLTANKTFGDHTLGATLVHEAVDFKNESMDGMRQGQGFQDFYTFTNFTDISSLNSGLGEYSLEGYAARATYDFKNRYFLSASVRRDGDSKMPPVNRWSNFWSVGGAWRLDNENFFNVSWVDNLKLRASYGRLGNNNFGTATNDYYPYQPGYAIGANNAAFPGAALSALGSPTLRWEGQSPFDAGVDFSLFGGRLEGTFEYYNRTSDGLLFDVPQPFHNGSSPTLGSQDGAFTVQQNLGGMRNSGIELSLTGGIIRKSDFRWDLTFNITTLRNKLLSMPEQTPAITDDPYRREAGRSINDFYTRKFYGIDPDNGRVLYQGVNEYNEESDQIKLIERGNGVVDTVTYDHNLARQGWVGKRALADAYGSIVNRFSYKNFDLNFIIIYSIGGYVMDSPYRGFMSPGPANGSALHEDLLNGWRNPGDVTDVPRMDLTQTAQFGANSDRFLTSASHIGIGTLSLAYRLPQQFVNRIHLNGARLFVSGENLYYWTARKGLNSMTSFQRTNTANAGAAANTNYSPARIFNVGVTFGLL